MSISEERLAQIREDHVFRTHKTPPGDWEEDQDVAELIAEVKRLNEDRDGWRECSRDWHSRAERAEKVERLYRDALVRIGGEQHQVALEALREASAVQCERTSGSNT